MEEVPPSCACHFDVRITLDGLKAAADFEVECPFESANAIDPLLAVLVTLKKDGVHRPATRRVRLTLVTSCRLTHD